MKFEYVKSKLDELAKKVINEAKVNLSKDDKGSGQLFESLTYEIDMEKDAFLLSFLMESYGPFVDKGVKGANPSLVKNGRQKAPDSPFSYKQKMPPMEPLSLWAKGKNIRFRDEKGRYKRGNYKTIGFWLQKRIFAQGLEATKFFNKPFMKYVNLYADKLIQAYSIDVEDRIILGIKK
tara:strand:+ start:40 stop:573 length:534 start_codon:yes stop_codon:yes gene_type:complete